MTITMGYIFCTASPIGFYYIMSIRVLIKPEYHQEVSVNTKQVLAHLQGHIPLILFLAQYLTSFFKFKNPMVKNWLKAITFPIHP